MKQIMAIFLIFVLGINVATNATAWTNDKQQLKTNVLSSQTTSEDAEDIANKLWNKTIKIDPNVFVGKNLKTDKKEVDVALVKDGVLTQNEAQYVSWGDLNINIAGWYWNKGSYTVTKDGATATGHVTIDADSGESPAMIAAKIAKTTNIGFNYEWWNKKSVQNYLPELQNILINEKILTKAEAYTTAGFASDFTINNQTGLFGIKLIVNDNNTSADAWAHINVIDDGSDAQQIANRINGYGLGLKTNTAGMYADSSYVTNNLRDLLVANYGQNAQDMQYVTLPHLKLAENNPNITAQVLKDGQIAFAKVDLECKTNSYIYYYYESYDYMQAYVNLTPPIVKNLQKYFGSSTHDLQNDLGYFYNILSNGTATMLPEYDGPKYLSADNRLNKNIDEYDKRWENPEFMMLKQTVMSVSGNVNFAKELLENVSTTDGYLSLMFEWHWTVDFWGIPTGDTVNYFFW